MNTVVSFENIINNDSDEIILFINELYEKNKNNIDKLKALIINSNFPYKYEILNVSDDIFLRNILMCLVYSSIDPYLGNTSIMKSYREKIKITCSELGLNIDNIVPICSIEEKLMKSLVL